MTELLPKPQLFWVDCSVISNFEATTLPLLYAPEDDCKQYFLAMKRKNPRKGLALEAVYALCLEARAFKEAGQPLDAVQKLREGAERRLQVFHPSDYQVTAAFEHCVQAAIHLGVTELSSVKSASAASLASSLFAFACDVLRECKEVSSSFGGGEGRRDAAELPPFVKTTLEFILFHNWTNYFVHRGKWHAAYLHAVHAEQKWNRLTTSINGGGEERHKAIPDFLMIRRLLLQERAGKDVPQARKELSQYLAHSNASTNDETSVSMEILNVVVAKEGEERELSFCLGASRPTTAWHGSLERATRTLCGYGLAMTDHALRHYQDALTTLHQFCANAVQENSSYNECVEHLERICHAKAETAAVIAQTVKPMPTTMTRSEGLLVQHLLKQYILSDRARKLRMKTERERKRQVIDDGVDDDEDPEVTKAKWAIPPTQAEVEGLLHEESKNSPVVAGFTTMFPLLQKKLPYKAAAKVLETSSLPIANPSEMMRSAMESRASAARSSPPRDASPDAAAEATRSAASATPNFVRGESREDARKAHPSVLPQKKKKVSTPKQLLDIYGDPKTKRAASALQSNEVSVSRRPSPDRMSNNNTRSRPTSASTLSASDRVMLVEEAAHTLALEESERYLDGLSLRQRASAEALRRFGNALLQLADAVDASAEILSRAEARAVVAAQEYDCVPRKSSSDDGSQIEVHHEKQSTSLLKSTSPPRALSPVSQLPDESPVRNASMSQPQVASQGEMANDGTQPVQRVDIEQVRAKQRHLRALLPSIDHHSTAYRMVVNELADNEKILQRQRDTEKLAVMARNAQLGAVRHSQRYGSGAGVNSLSLLSGSNPERDMHSDEAIRGSSSFAAPLPLPSQVELSVIAAALGVMFLSVDDEGKTKGVLSNEEEVVG